MVDHKLIEEQLIKYAREPIKKKTGQPDWSLNSRNLIAAVIFGRMGAPIPRGSKDKIPSIAAPVLDKISHPFAGVLKEFRSKSTTVGSIKGSFEHTRPASAFGMGEGQERVRIIYTILGYGNVERVFTQAKESLPISSDKRIRYALGPKNVGQLALNPETHMDLVNFLPADEVMATGEIHV